MGVGGCPVNGGEISIEDAGAALRRAIRSRLAGTGRTADIIAAAVADPASCGDARIAQLAKSAIVRVADVADRTAAAAQIRTCLAPRSS